MSDSFAIAAVTATISYILKQEGGITVSRKPPDTSTGSDARLNIFLYQVTPNLGYFNADSPARNYSGELVRKQQLGLDLHYLLTAYGKNDDDLSAQKTLADTMRILHENPILSRQLIKAAKNDSQFTDIESSDLDEQIELIKITLQSLSLEELTKIWSSFFKTGSYRISVAYKATVVLLDGRHESRSALPVNEINSYVYSSRAPEITYIDPQMVPWTSGQLKIRINGRNLRADAIKVDFGEGLEVEDMPEPLSVSAKELSVTIPDTIAPGIKQVRVLHPLSIGTPEKLHNGLESNLALFGVVPVITDVNPSPIKAKQKLTVKFEPAISENQHISVIISTYKPLEAERPTDDAIDDVRTDTVKVTIPEDYQTNIELPVRLKVDDVESQPDAEKWKNEFKRPVVRIVT